MPAAAELRREVDRLRRAVVNWLTPADSPALEAVRADRSAVMRLAGLSPDGWQAELCRSEENVLALCSRQAGKSVAAAALALAVALTEPASLILLLSPTLRQSGELFRAKLLPLYDAAPLVAAVARTQLTIELANRSRIVSLPENEEGIRGFSGVRLLVIDEASRVSDALYYAIRPMLAVSGGRLVALSTPFGKRGWYFHEWTEGAGWRRARVTADQCGRIDPAFLAAERLSLGPRWYAQEFQCEFSDAIDATFMNDDIQAALSTAPPWLEVTP